MSIDGNAKTYPATQGGGGISPTFGAALWILDYVMQTVLMGTNALYFHQGTIGNCKLFGNSCLPNLTFKANTAGGAATI